MNQFDEENFKIQSDKNEWSSEEIIDTKQNNDLQYAQEQNVNSAEVQPPQADPFQEQENYWFQYRRQAKRLVSRTGWSLFLFAFCVLAFENITVILVDHYKPWIVESDWFTIVLTAVAMLFVGLPVFALRTRKIPDTPKGEVVKLKPIRFIMIFFICVAAMYISSIASSILTLFIAFLKGDMELYNPAADAIMNSNFALTLIYVGFGAPIVEELIFRKILLDKLRRFGDVPAILMTGIAFGLFHMNLSQMFYAAVLGFIFAYVTIRTNTIRYSILLHMMINTISTAFITPVALSGNILGSIYIVQWVIGGVAVGALFFAFNYKKIKLEKAAPILKKSAFLLNPGTIAFLVICLLYTAFVTIVS